MSESDSRARSSARQILRWIDSGHSVAVILCVDRDPRRSARRVLVADSGETHGSLGDPSLDAKAVELGRVALLEGREREGLQTVAATDDSDVRVFVELHRPTPQLVIVGAGHVAQPLATVGTLLGFDVVVLDDRPDFATTERFPTARRVVRVDFDDPFGDVPIRSSSHVVLVTRGHKYDYECLRHLLASDPQPAYVGMIGSRRRVRATMAQLIDEGVDRERLSRVRAPIGLDLRAETPAEIAVAVAGEMVLSWRGGTGAPLSGRERILERFFPE
jgi:xanthine dehydrogenase accessory factor